MGFLRLGVFAEKRNIMNAETAATQFDDVAELPQEAIHCWASHAAKGREIFLANVNPTVGRQQGQPIMESQDPPSQARVDR